jgi:hypothetical protein
MAKSSPYYLFGAERRYPYAWHGGAGGVPSSRPAAETRELGSADMIESGLDPNFIPYPAFNHTRFHDPSLELAGLGDFPLRRPAGKEPLDPHQLADLSDNEKKYGALAIAGLAALWLYKRSKKRRR